MKYSISIAVLFLICIISNSIAGEPAIKRAITFKKLADNKNQVTFNFEIIDEISSRIAVHAREYPPSFKDNQQRCEIENELRITLEVLDIFWEDDNGLTNPEFLLRVGYLHSMGHNLDFYGSAEKAACAFSRLLNVEPNHPKGNYLYGMFLSSTATHAAESITYLKKALDLGVEEAKYTIGLEYLELGNEKEGLRYLEEYAFSHPDSRAPYILKAYKEGKLKFEKSY